MGFILNTSYKVQVDLLESESNINIENGTLHVIDNKLKVHLNDEIKTITISNYKVYTALLTQSGTGAPVATVLENTIGNIWFTYDGIGTYLIHSDGLFTGNKTVSFFQNTTDDGNNSSTNLGYGGTYPDNIQIITALQSQGLWSNSDGLLYNTPIEIRVYN